jgi:uncharacterized protein YwgA
MQTIDVTRMFQEFGLITFITEIFNQERVPQTRIDRLTFQKMIYIIQEIYGVPLGYEFKLYNYGPHSPDVDGDVEYAEYLKGIKEEFVGRVDGYDKYTLDPGEEAQEVRQKAITFIESDYGRKIEEAVNRFRDYSLKELDIITTVHMVYGQMKEEARKRENLFQETKAIKPKADNEMVKKMIDALAGIKAIEV